MPHTFILRKRNDINPDDYKLRGMEIVDKTHDEISVNKTVNTQSFIKIHTGKEIFFSSMAVKTLGLSPGLFIHFVNEDDQWHFYVDNDPDGFKLSEKVIGMRTLSIFNQALIELFLKRTKCFSPCKFPLVILKAKLNGKQLIKIEINKPIE